MALTRAGKVIVAVSLSVALLAAFLPPDLLLSSSLLTHLLDRLVGARALPPTPVACVWGVIH